MLSSEQAQDQPLASFSPAPVRKRSVGESWVWLCSGALSLTLLALLGLILLIFTQGFRALWPQAVEELALKDGSRLLGEIIEVDSELARLHIKRGNRDLYGMDFAWLEEEKILSRDRPASAYLLERQEHGVFFGFLAPEMGAEQFRHLLNQARKERNRVKAAEEGLNSWNHRLASLERDLASSGEDSGARANLLAKKATLERQFQEEIERVQALQASLLELKIPFTDVSGQPLAISAAAILRAVQPNDLSLPGKVALFVSRFCGLIADAPREANTEGGLFPAIFGTALMVLLMSLFATPLGVVVAVYLHEYTRGGWLVRLVRVTVNNLAGVPSIVYGIFGLQFFVYGIGGTLDELFFSETLPSPTFGTGGLLWASLTMALLTLPVVIVATEEGLTAVPKGMREGALALGASQWQTLWRVVLPMSSPGILTGVILSIARAAGEVAPLMLVGVIKLAPHLALDGQFPYFHPERKFMHLGFHIYDVGFQSPNVDAAIPMVYVTTFFLLALVLGLNAFAMILRQRLRSRFQGGAF